MIQVLDVRPDGTAVVSTIGLFRVVLQPSGGIIGELMENGEAIAVQESVARRHPDGDEFAEVMSYADALKCASN